MQAARDEALSKLDWLVQLGVDRNDLAELNPCIPGEFTLPTALYVNTATPRIIYHGTEEGTLPLVAGRWYLIPNSIVEKVGALQRDTVPVARAVRLAS